MNISLDELFAEEERPSFDSKKRQEDIGRIIEHFKANREELGRLKVASPDPAAGEGHYRVTCDKGRQYKITIDNGNLVIKPLK